LRFELGASYFSQREATRSVPGARPGRRTDAQRPIELPTLPALLLVGVVFVGQLLAGLVLRVGALHPEGLVSKAAHGTLLTAHGSLVFGWANAVQLWLALALHPASAPSSLHRWAALVALWLTAIQSVVLLWSTFLPLPEQVVAVSMTWPSLATTCALVFTMVRTRHDGWLFTAALGLCALGAPLLLAPSGEHSLVLAVLLIHVARNPERRFRETRRVVGGLAALSALLAFRLHAAVAFVVLSVAQFFVALALIVAGWKQLAQMSPLGGAQTFAKAGLLLLAVASLLRLWLGGRSMNWSSTTRCFWSPPITQKRWGSPCSWPLAPQASSPFEIRGSGASAHLRMGSLRPEQGPYGRGHAARSTPIPSLPKAESGVSPATE